MTPADGVDYPATRVVSALITETVKDSIYAMPKADSGEPIVLCLVLSSSPIKVIVWLAKLILLAVGVLLLVRLEYALLLLAKLYVKERGTILLLAKLPTALVLDSPLSLSSK